VAKQKPDRRLHAMLFYYSPIFATLPADQ